FVGMTGAGLSLMLFATQGVRCGVGDSVRQTTALSADACWDRREEGAGDPTGNASDAGKTIQRVRDKADVPSERPEFPLPQIGCGIHTCLARCWGSLAGGHNQFRGRRRSIAVAKVCV